MFTYKYFDMGKDVCVYVEKYLNRDVQRNVGE